jgi:hypothetical protein
MKSADRWQDLSLSQQYCYGVRSPGIWLCCAGYVFLSYSRKDVDFIINIKKYVALDYEGTTFLFQPENSHQTAPYRSQARMDPQMIEWFLSDESL